jgi:uronate dehydrogenase
LVQLIRIGLDHPDIHLEIFYGASDNEAARWNNRNAQAFRLPPERRLTRFPCQAMAAQAKQLPPDPMGDRF